MIKTLFGFLLVVLVFGGICYYSVQSANNKYYESRKAESYNGVVEKKEIYKKGGVKERCIIFFKDKTNISNDYNLYDVLEIGDSISKAPNSPSIQIYHKDTLKTFTFLKPEIFRKKNFTINFQKVMDQEVAN